MQAHRGAADVTACCGLVENQAVAPSCLVRAASRIPVFTASRIARCFAERPAVGVTGCPHGLIVRATELDRLVPHEGATGLSALQESRALRIAARDSPGGERGHPAAPTGVAGTVSNAVLPKRHRLPSPAEHSEALSSEALVCPKSVVCSLSLRSSVKAAPLTVCAAPSSATAPATCLLFEASASALSKAAPCLACANASRATLLFAEPTTGGVIGAPDGLIVSIAEADLAGTAT